MNANDVSILIVDDLPEKHVVFRSILEDLGERIVSVRSGREALAQLLDHEFAVILLDIHMPDIDGLETANLIRAHRRSARTPILFITAYVDEAQARQGYALGAVDYIPSPVVPQVLRSKVRVFVELYRMNRQLKVRAAEREALARAEAARAAAEEASARADFLAEASQTLARSLDLEQTRRALIALIVPRLADRAWLVDLATEQPEPGVVILPLDPARPQAGALVLQAPPARMDAARLALTRELVSRAAIALDNARLYAAVREADQRKNEFLAMLAHELRNPLAPIRNAVHIMQGVPHAPAMLVWARDVISRQATHMARLIDDLLDVSRIVQGKVVVHRERLALASVIDRCVESTAPRLAERGQTLRLDLPAEPVMLHGDAVRLTQVLSNLVHNASKFSQDAAAIDLSVRVVDEAVVVSVRDRGCGVDPALLPRIFDLFVQGEQTLDRAQGGLGVGLTLVQHLVHLHGGQVQARSEGHGQGTEVQVRLPLAAAPPAVAAPLSSGEGRADAVAMLEVPADRCRRVLVVDDQAASAETLTLLLEMEGFDVQVAGEGQQALALADAFRPDAVLLDIGLPGMSGFEVAMRLRETPAGRETLLVALTGYGEAQSRLRSAQAGFDIHLVKPADLNQLLGLLADPQRAKRMQEA